MKRTILLLAAALAATASFSRDTNRYDRVETRDGITFSQRGGLGLSNEVVTAVNMASVISAATNSAYFTVFSNAVDAVTPPIEERSESDPHVASWARKSGGVDPSSPVFSETDPNVPSWAKETNPPTETDPNVSSWAKKSGTEDAPYPFLGHGLVLTNGSAKTYSGTSVTASHVSAIPAVASGEERTYSYYALPDALAEAISVTNLHYETMTVRQRGALIDAIVEYIKARERIE